MLYHIHGTSIVVAVASWGWGERGARVESEGVATYHALAVCRNAFGQDGVAQFLEVFLWITRRRSLEEQHVQIRHLEGVKGVFASDWTHRAFGSLVWRFQSALVTALARRPLPPAFRGSHVPFRVCWFFLHRQTPYLCGKYDSAYALCYGMSSAEIQYGGTK
jgi:hypothetical protein